jgi:hypothetical protein
MPAWYYHLPWLLLAETECLTPLSVSVLICLQSGVMCSIVGQGRKHDQLVFSSCIVWVLLVFLVCKEKDANHIQRNPLLGVSSVCGLHPFLCVQEGLTFSLCVINPTWHPSLNSVSILLAPVIHQPTNNSNRFHPNLQPLWSYVAIITIFKHWLLPFSWKLSINLVNWAQELQILVEKGIKRQ